MAVISALGSTMYLSSELPVSFGKVIDVIHAILRFERNTQLQRPVIPVIAAINFSKCLTST